MPSVNSTSSAQPTNVENAAWPATDANSTLAIEDFGLDPDDDTALAEYNARFFE